MTVARPSVFRRPDYVRLWSAATVSLLGTQVSQVAMPVIAVLVLRATPFEVALLGTFEFLPFMLFTLPAGVWVDRLPRRLILVAGDFGRAAALMTIPIAWFLGALTIPQLYVVGFITGILTVFFDVADQSFLPGILEPEDLVDGNAKLQVSASAAQIVGQPLGGAAVGLLGAPLAVVADALSFVGSGALIFLIRGGRARSGLSPGESEPAESAAPAARGAEMRREVTEGLRFVLGDPWLRPIALATGTSNLFSNLAFATIAVYFYRDLGLSPAIVGTLGGIGGVGVLAGALLAARLASRIGVGRTIVLAMFIGVPAAIAVPIAPHDGALPFLAVGAFLGSASVVIYNVNQVSLRQAICPERLLGRMNATMRFIVWGTIPIGQIVGGLLASVIGTHATIWAGSLLEILAIVPILLSPVPTIRTIPSSAAEVNDAEAPPPSASSIGTRTPRSRATSTARS